MIDVYLHRNLVVAKAYGVRSGIGVALIRLRNHKRKQKWLISLLEKEWEKLDAVIAEAIKHRDEYKEAAHE